MIYTLPDLPYKNDALAPSISKETVDYHYGKHERAYIEIGRASCRERV